jgi:hypothetical protein
VINSDYGGCSGVYKYDPSTQTFQSTGNFSAPGFSQPFYIHNIKIHPADNQLVYVCSTQGLFLSTDGGTTWNIILGGDVYNVAFMPRSSGYTGVYTSSPYFIYATAENDFLQSADDGQSFSPISGMTGLWSSYGYVLSDLVYTPSSVNANEYYIYLFSYLQYAPVTPPATQPLNEYGVFQYKYNSSSGSLSSVMVHTYHEVSGSTDWTTSDRLSIAANDQGVYFGARDFWRLNNAVTPAVKSGISTGHADHHGAVFLKNCNKLLTVSDGGCFIGSYSPSFTPDNGYGTISGVLQNNGLHISQVNGFSCSEEDPDAYITGEQDTQEFYTKTSTTTENTLGFTEGPGGIIDKFDNNRIFVRTSSYNSSVYAGVRTFLSGPGSGFTTILHQESGTTSLCNSTYDPMYPNLGDGPFSKNTLFQDPNRPDKIYYGTRQSLYEYCSSSNKLFFLISADSHTTILTMTGLNGEILQFL